jgi:hypothetical protein
MTAEPGGIGNRVKENVEETKEGLEETYEQRPGDSAGKKVGGIFKQAVEDVEEAGHSDEQD